MILFCLAVGFIQAIIVHSKELPINSAEEETVEVQTRLGLIEGVQAVHGNKKVRSFLSVPFAEPPIGKERFRPPRPKRPWNATIDARTLSPACFQGKDSYAPGFWGSEMWNANTPISEDCLYLNIWTPTDAFNLTVLVWLFGGGFWYGSPSLQLYDGKELAVRGNVVVVNVNYRVGPFGYLYLDNDDVPGNMGMLDQQLAMYWIRDHIFAFGGNPSRVTLFGESAGAASIVAHLIAPSSKGLFKNGILQSGSLDNKWSMDTPKRAKQKSDALAALVGCNHTEIKQVVNCLRETPAQLLVDNIWNVGLEFLEFPFAIVSRDRNFFMNKDGFLSLRNGDFTQNVNLMFGINHDEGNFWNIYNLPTYFDKKPIQPQLNKFEFENCIETAFATQPSLVRSAAKFVYSDANCTDSLIRTAFYAEQVNQMVGDYFFTANPWPTWTGVMHGYEIEYVFGVPLHNKTAGYTKKEMELSDKVIEYWTSFATNGVPRIKRAGTNERWPQYDGKNRTKWMLLKGDAIRPIPRKKSVECDLWRKAKDLEYSAYLHLRNYL
ncbi:hypothetical protein WR25_17174 isoform A [Diploscapter pachys]|uniref:Carboxylic ester hydrolase n=2 Tax=Diploscapter pachys TaxID=2018661 RepID=A0A2A2LD81_9BILA|nr:hypothetical protein WR25_17174 isoform A [Diploscapter pachys]